MVVAFSPPLTSLRLFHVFETATPNRSLLSSSSSVAIRKSKDFFIWKEQEDEEEEFSWSLMMSSSKDNDNDNDNDDSLWDSESLSRRIADMEESSQQFEMGLQRRVRKLSEAQWKEEQLLSSSNNNNNNNNTNNSNNDVNKNNNKNNDNLRTTSDNDNEEEEEDGRRMHHPLAVICFDALLAKQRLKGSTRDVMFGKLLRSLGLGGIFVMTSLNLKQRKLRRTGVLTRIELIDVEDHNASSSSSIVEPTSVDFSLVGIANCEIIGPSHNMKARVGRWRRSYDEDGEESILGWGMESFCDIITTDIPTNHKQEEEEEHQQQEKQKLSSLSCKEWNLNNVQVQINYKEQDKDASEIDIGRAENLIKRIDQWYELASSDDTYDELKRRRRNNVKSSSSFSRMNHRPSRLLKNVLKDLGTRPPATQPTALCFWAAALVNPLPPLGVAPEMRGNLLEAPTIEKRLNILERGIQRSIANLDGSCPL